MANISAIKLPNNDTYYFKDADGRYTQNLIRPNQLNGLADPTLQTLVSTTRANRLAFLPADQIIIEKTTDGGATWIDAGYSDATKTGLFSETRVGVFVPLVNGVRDIKSGLRITITGMKYNVPEGTAETAKYNYWNSNYIKSCERYCQLKEIYFWVSTANAGLSVKVERATGSNSTSWSTIYDSGSTYALTGWSGCDYVRFSQGVFGGGTTQTSNYWNYRFTFFQRNSTGGTTLPDSYTTSNGGIYEIRGYGDTYWTAGNRYMAEDHMYTWDYNKNVTFPAQVNGTINVNTTVGTLAIAHGGTGATSAAGAIDNLLNGLPVWSAAPTDTTYFIRQDTGGSATYGKVPASTLWTYISGKLPSWSQASSKPSYTFSEIGSKPTTLSGYGITDAKIANGVITLGSNSITPLTSYTDEKVKVAEYSQSTTYYPILATGTGTATRQIATNGMSFRESGGGVILDLGLDSSHWGILSLGGESQYKTTISGLTITANRSLTLPDKSGTIALTSDIPAVKSLTFTMDTTDTKKLKITYA